MVKAMERPSGDQEAALGARNTWVRREVWPVSM
jgi:hypothetical protein